jgi:murein DD-endopeptidase MepM/ murein hydrolase activator NlpD
MVLLAVSACASTTESTSTSTEAPLPPGRAVVAQQGDTVRELADEAGLSEAEVREVNGLGPDDELVPGMRVFLPASAPEPPPAPTPASSKPSKPVTSTPSKPSTPTSSTARLVWPVEGLVLRDFAVAKGKKPGFDGLLIGAPAGTDVVAADEGRVVFAGTQNTATGNFVVVDHGELVTIYAHLRHVRVTAGQAVARGEVVGEIGATGLSGVSPRVEFQVRKKSFGDNGRDDNAPALPIDPLPLLPP